MAVYMSVASALAQILSFVTETVASAMCNNFSTANTTWMELILLKMKIKFNSLI